MKHKTINSTLKNFLINFGGFQYDPWSRVVMNQETQRLISDLSYKKFSVLEISGDSWKNFGFKTYKSISYPEFDICNTSLDECFDLIIAEQVFEHLLWPYRAAKNVLQMLNPGGYFLLTTPFLIRVHDFPVDCSRWTQIGIKYFLSESGFPLEDVTSGSWGNLACVKANLKRWMPYHSLLHSLSNDPEFPVMVWALARKDDLLNSNT